MGMWGGWQNVHGFERYHLPEEHKLISGLDEEHLVAGLHLTPNQSQPTGFREENRIGFVSRVCIRWPHQSKVNITIFRGINIGGFQGPPQKTTMKKMTKKFGPRGNLVQEAEFFE